MNIRAVSYTHLLDEGDNNPARFWRHLAVALEPHCRGLFRSVEENLFLSDPGSAAAAAVFIERAKAVSYTHL